MSGNQRDQLIRGHNQNLSKEKEKINKEAQNMNIRAAMIHMLGDMVQSIGVIAASVIILLKPEWQIADPVCTYIFSVLVLFTTVPIFTDCIKIIMEASPGDIDT